MDHNNPGALKDLSGEPGLTAEWENSESFSPEKEQWRCVVAEDVTTNGSWSQRSISRSLQRAETLLRSTFNPSLKWLFHGCSQDEDAEEGNFVAAHNLVSRSSARLLHLQQALLTVAPQWQPVGGAQVCVKGLPAEGGVLLQPSSSLQGHYRTLCRLLEQRSLLLFIHEYTRRARLTATFISRVNQLLEDQLKKSHLRINQTPFSWSSFRVSLGSLSQELRVHLNHWSCLFSKVQSDHYLRPALVQQTRLLGEIKQSLGCLGLQALVLMERYVYVTLSATGQAELHSVPREVLEDILAGTEVYNQAVEEQRAQHSATQLRTSVLHQAHSSTPYSSFLNSKEYHPAVFSVRELTTILAVHHAEMAAKPLLCWVSAQSDQICQVHNNHKAHTCSVNSTIRSECNWEQMPYAYLISSPLSYHRALHSSTCHTCHETPVYIPGLHFDTTYLENHHPVLAKSSSVQHRTDCSKKDHTHQCQTWICQTGGVQTSTEALDSAQLNVERQKILENCKLLQSPSDTPHHPSALPLSVVCQQDRSSVEFLFQVLVSSSDLLAPLVSHMSTPEAPTERLQPNTVTDVLSPKTEPMISTAPIINTADSVELNRLSTELNKDQTMEGTHLEWAELEITTRLETTDRSGFQGDGDPEKEETVGAEGTTVESDCVRWPHSVQWLDLGQSLVFSDLFGQYRTLLWSLCNRALWLQIHTPQTGNAAGSINLQDTHRGFLHHISQASKTGLVPKECRAMLENLSLNLLVSTAHAQWDYGSFSHLPLRPTLHRQTVSLMLATVQLSTVWVMSKAYQFLSSWSLSKFLLITQGDLKVLRASVEMMVHQTKSLVMNSDSDQSALQNHSQLLLRQQLEALGRAVSELQTFSTVVLKTFSTDCKRMSGEIFEQTMPSSVHWRPSHRTGYPSSPSEYSYLAAQTVIGQVLEGVALLPDDARVQALSITMTAFLEAWMEHILRQKIKFSVQGALQLKQDFDSIRELIQSDKYGLSAELHQRLLSLRVFQQVDSAVVCLLQQPQAKPYLQSRAWGPFTRYCPANSGRDSMGEAVGSSITNLRCMEGEDQTQSDPSVVTTELPPVEPSTPGEPYLAPSLALGAAQQEWLDLRIHSSACRWRLPGLRCFSKSEP
ncbi:uncharacterized protein ccdc142 isoform X2 [Lates calcarifer]|uniref:Uncharacterized protein ccdc142 isoform X2 n=1 Tax=Lates calcarifer TaxID=8187 RepID=A0AAJ7LCP1_LATCA|nr:uncharacterized protein ccdc142 isoform X2 [Lates calcarifer]